ncbi:unnamed protein product [Didymodactylos carnosus]|uniref:Uncharacterized protein n=1 Tax=Didymodactylos carnosus TaxID=1234261 RepID=A0A8S2DJ47_9BILA|nr:unnamed protein product [Didymodactylos carnosus]CAF3715785.1 unnamed protein product [Didymodactylos carnosus]
MRIPIITQNFISPHQNGTSDLYGTQPLMLLPQSQQTIFDGQQQNSFNNLFLHDLNRHRTTYIRSYNAYETVKKRQDFVLRKENLKSLYRIEDRLERKKEQHIGQTLHAYEQCFVKVINNNPYSSIIGQRPRTAAPIQLQVQLPVAFDKFHSHHLSHSNPAIKTEQDSNSQQQQRPQTSVSQQAFYRYQKNHRPKFKQSNVIYKTVQSFHDACLQQQQQQKQPVVQHQSKDFLSFTESYLQKFDNNSFPNAKQTSSTIIWQKPCGNERQRPLSAVPSFESVTAVDTKNKKHRQQEQDVTIKVAIQQRTKTPRSSPILDAVENEIQLNDDAHSDEGKKLRQKPFGSKNNNTQSLITNLTTGNDKKSTVITTTDDDIVKEAMFIRNYNEPKTTPTSSVINSQAKSTITVHQKSSPSSSTVIRRRLSVSSSTSKLLKSSTNSQLVETELTVIAKQPEELIVESMQQQSQEQGIKEKKDDDEIGTVHNTKLIKKLPLPNKRTKTSAFDKNSETLNDMVIFEHGLNDKSKNSRDNVDDEENVMMKNDNGITDLLEKIKQGTNPLLLGQTALSQQVRLFLYVGKTKTVVL